MTRSPRWRTAARTIDLPLDALDLLVEGVEFDVRGTRYETFDELVGYCRRVAGSVGRLCLAIFSDGRRAPGAAALADDLGVAMQLTNILRDIREDERLRAGLPAGRGPAALRLSTARRRRAPPRALRPDPASRPARAGEWFDRGLALTAMLDSRSASCVLAMTGIYRSILDRIIEDPAQVLVAADLADDLARRRGSQLRSLATARVSLEQRSHGARTRARSVVVIGGGLAGIAAALDCARDGAHRHPARVARPARRRRLFVRSRRPARWTTASTSSCAAAPPIGACLRDIGAEDLVTLQPRLRITVLAPAGAGRCWRAARLPAPVHLAGALLRYQFVSRSAQRLAAARAMQALRTVDPDDPAADARSFGDWLAEHGQERRGARRSSGT